MTSTRIDRDSFGIPLMPFAPFAPNQAIKACQPIVEGLAELNGKAMMSCLEFNREWTGFLMRRLQQDITLIHDLAKCSEPSEVFAVYSAFHGRALSDYQREFAHLATLNGKGLEQTTRALQDPQGTMDNIARPTQAAA